MPGEPADQGGVRAEDVIIALDGTPMDAPRDLQRVVSSTPVGKRVRVVVLRAGEQKEMDVTIGRYKEREKPDAVAQARARGVARAASVARAQGSASVGTGP